MSCAYCMHIHVVDGHRLAPFWRRHCAVLSGEPSPERVLESSKLALVGGPNALKGKCRRLRGVNK